MASIGGGGGLQIPLPSLLREYSAIREEQQCGICFEPLTNLGHAALRLGCSCPFHYTCLVSYVRSKLGDKDAIIKALQDEAHEGILCPCDAGAFSTCRFTSSSSSARGGGGGVQQQRYFIGLGDLEALVSLREEIVQSPRGHGALESAAAEAGEDEEDLYLTHEEVLKLKGWLHEFYHPPFPPTQGDSLTREPSGSDPLLIATTKLCPTPGCGNRGVHFHGHHCHHVTEGCSKCRVQYCYACNATADENTSQRGSRNVCRCPSRNWSSACKPLKNKRDIERYLVLKPFPHDSRCGCPVCPDCRKGKPCDRCGSPEGDWNCAVCGKYT